jgi:hypothetical protein
VLDDKKFSACMLAVGNVQEQLIIWKSPPSLVVDPIKQGNTLGTLRSCLAECPDEAPAPDRTALNFVTDIQLRESISRDMGVMLGLRYPATVI